MPLRKKDLFIDAIDLLREADRLHQHFFRVRLGHAQPRWEPPVDIVECDRTLSVCVALPGVDRDGIEVASDGASLHVVAYRTMSVGPHDTIHRLEVPYGRFERHIDLPPGRYEMLTHEMDNGCLLLRLRRLA